MKQENVIYRRAKEDDFESIYSIWLNGIGYTFSDFTIPENLKEEFYNVFLQREGYFDFWIAVVGKNIVTAYCSILPCTLNPIKKDTIGELSIYSIKNSLASSNALSLMSFVIQELKNSPVQHLIAFSRNDNLKGINILERVGFTIDEPLKFPNYSKSILSMTV